MDGQMKPQYERAEKIINGEQPGTGGGCRNLRDFALAFPVGPATYRAPRGAWRDEPRMDRVVDGVADGMDRIAALGNGQVPAVVVLAWKLLGPLADGQRSVEESNTKISHAP